MALSTKAITIEVPGSTGNADHTGFGFAPKACIFFATLRTSDGQSPNFQMCVGFCAENTPGNVRDRGSSAADQDGQTTSNAFSASDADAITVRDPTGTIIVQGTVIEHLSDGLKITWTVVSSGVDIHCLALGGASVIDGDVLLTTAQGTTGQQVISFFSSPFSPNFALMLMVRGPSASRYCLGAAKSSTERWAATFAFNDNDVVDDTARAFSSALCLYHVNAAGDIMDRADFVSFGSNEMTIDWLQSSGNAYNIAVLALELDVVDVGTIEQPTSTGDQVISGLSAETVKGLLLCSAGFETGGTRNGNAEFAIGGADSAGAERSIWSGATDGANPTVSDHDSDSTKILKFFTPGTPTLVAAADFDSFGANEATINWGTVDSTPRLIGYVAFGELSDLQYARPISDISAGTWTPSTGSDLYATIDEEVADDADYDRSAANPVADVMEVQLTSLSTPDTGDVTIVVRFRRTP